MTQRENFETLARYSLRTILGFQAGHVDLSFYERFYRPEALSEPQRQHRELWHS
jgi:hypothetical protein